MQDGNKNFIFYWHVQAAQDADTATLVIWLNCGAGCFSMQGCYIRNSPFKLPVGAVMSFSRGTDYQSDEWIVAGDVYDFMTKLLQRHIENFAGGVSKYYSRALPKFGESHGRRWISEVSDDTMKQNNDPSNQSEIRLNGVGIGNGRVHPQFQDEYIDYAQWLKLLNFGQMQSLMASLADCLAALDGKTCYLISCFSNINAITSSVEPTRVHGFSNQKGSYGLRVEACADADWGSNINDQCSVLGIMIMIGDAPVIFKSKYQRMVALSFAIAFYMAMSLCTQWVLWVRAMLKDLGHEQEQATQIWGDSHGVIALASNAGYKARTKHVDIRHHFIRENVAQDIIKVDYITTDHQLADMMTKALGTK